MVQTRFSKRFPSATLYQLDETEQKARRSQTIKLVCGALIMLAGFLIMVYLEVNPWIVTGLLLATLFGISMISSKTPGADKVLVRGPGLQWYQVTSDEDIKRAANRAGSAPLVIALFPILSPVIYPVQVIHGYDILWAVGLVALMGIVGLKEHARLLKYLPQDL